MMPDMNFEQLSPIYNYFVVDIDDNARSSMPIADQIKIQYECIFEFRVRGI